MLLSATVSGMPDWSRFASCWVNVASSCSFGLRFCGSCARSVGGRNESKSAFCPAAPAAGRRARLGRFHGDGKKPEPLDLRQRRRPVGHVEHALDEFAAAPARLVGKFRHNLTINLKPSLGESCKIMPARLRIVLDAGGLFDWIVPI